MNRDALLELAERIEGNAWMIRRFLHDPEMADHMVALEVLGRCNIIDAKLAQIRKEMARPESGRPDSHVLGDREGVVHHFHVPAAPANPRLVAEHLRRKGGDAA
jgi:hypothetical protein